MDYLRAFLVGGIICGLAQILLDKTKMMPGRVMVTLVVGGVSWDLRGSMSLFPNGQAPEPQFLFWGLAIPCGKG